MIFALCLAAMGIQKFFDKPVSWRATWLVMGLSFAGLSFFMFVYDSVAGAHHHLHDRPGSSAGAERQAAADPA